LVVRTTGGFELTVSMLSPAKISAPIKARTTVRVTCQGYPSVTIEEREAEVAVLNPPRLDFGMITVTPSKQ
jgi:hypothetical protein